MKVDQQQRGVFLESLIKASPDLGAVFLNHSGSPERLLTDIESVDLLAEKKVFQKILEFTLKHPLVRQVKQVSFFRMVEFWVEFEDHTALRLRLIRSFIRKGLRCLDPNFIRLSTHTNEFGMLVPSESLHFEYLILAAQFNKVHLADRYRHHFSAMDDDKRGPLFGYINERFSLVIHKLDDLYDYSPSMLFKIVLALRKRKENSLFKISFRILELAMFKLLKPIFFKTKVHMPQSISSTIKNAPEEASKRTAETAIL